MDDHAEKRYIGEIYELRGANETFQRMCGELIESVARQHDQLVHLRKLLEEPSDEVVEKVADNMFTAAINVDHTPRSDGMCDTRLIYKEQAKAAIKAFQEAVRENI